MAFTARIFGLLEQELSRHLMARFELVSNRTRPGAATLQPGDEARVRVWVRNESGLALRGIRGEVVPARGVRFDRRRFSLGRLRPHLDVAIGEVEIRVGVPDHAPVLVDRIGSVRVSASADLSEFRFRAEGTPIVADSARDARRIAARARPRPDVLQVAGD